jgi:twinkle protein
MNLAELIPLVPFGGSGRFACPSCSPHRRKSNLKDLAVTRKDDVLLYNCHHCGENGLYPIKERIMSAVPAQVIRHDLQSQHLAFLLSRGISPETATKAKLFATDRWFNRLNATADCIAFPYYKDAKLISSKYRSISAKDFTQDAGGAHSFWNVDDLQDGHPIVIVEGEIDALTLMEMGIPNVLSVPAGAPLKVVEGKVSPTEDKKFAFVWDAFERLNKAPWVILAGDNDAPGHALAEELARRIGKDKCKLAKVTRKDINEVYLKDGADAVKEIIDKAEPYPVQGISSAKDFSDRLNDLWTKGTGKGLSTGYASVDQIYTVVAGQMTVVTGYPSSGKSNFVDQMMVNLAKANDWKFALCSFENAPEVHISRLIEIYLNKRFFDGSSRMNEEEFKHGYDWVNDHFLFLTSESSEPATIDSIMSRAKIAVARFGVRGLVIDPYNYIDRGRGTSETEEISNMLTRVQQFAKSSGVHVWFVAHPSKIIRSGVDLPRPDGMSISGSMAWWAKADCGITVHRIKHDTQIAVWKCRYRWVGTTGECLLNYDKATGTYREVTDHF